MVAPVGARRTAAGELIPLPARRYVLRVRVDDTEYLYDATARLPQAQAHVVAAIREGAPAGGGAALVAMEGALRTAARLAMPLIVRLVAALRAAPIGALLLPELARPPKHTDPMEHLACWLTEAVFTALGTGVYVLEPDDAAAYLDVDRDVVVLPVRRLHWSGGVVEAEDDVPAEDGREVAP